MNKNSSTDKKDKLHETGGKILQLLVKKKLSIIDAMILLSDLRMHLLKNAEEYIIANNNPDDKTNEALHHIASCYAISSAKESKMIEDYFKRYLDIDINAEV